MARYKGTQASHLYEKSMHTLCTIQWATTPGWSLNYPRPKSITHLISVTSVHNLDILLYSSIYILCSIYTSYILWQLTCQGSVLPVFYIVQVYVVDVRYINYDSPVRWQCHLYCVPVPHHVTNHHCHLGIVHTIIYLVYCNNRIYRYIVVITGRPRAVTLIQVS